jgi:antitoxin (DNA-binding transcriptional repressor) of toxin-antitoxin stability system
MHPRTMRGQGVLWIVCCLLAMYSVLDPVDQAPTVVPLGASFAALGAPDDDDASDDDGGVSSAAGVIFAVTVIPSRSCTNALESLSMQGLARRDMSGLTRGPPRKRHGMVVRVLAFSAFSVAVEIGRRSSAVARACNPSAFVIAHRATHRPNRELASSALWRNKRRKYRPCDRGRSPPTAASSHSPSDANDDVEGKTTRNEVNGEGEYWFEK